MVSFRISRMNRCDMFLAAWVLYYLQGIVYPEGGAISITLLGLTLLVSANCAIKVLQWRNAPVYFKGFNMLILLFTVYGFALIVSSPSALYYPLSGMKMPSYNYIKSIYLSLLPIYPFYYYTKKGYLTVERLRIWGLIFLASVAMSYFRMQREALAQLLEGGSSVEDVTNNAGYLFLSILPMLVIYRKKPLLQFATFAFVMAFLIMGMKRGAIIIGAISAIYFMWRVVQSSRGNTRSLFIFLSVAICVGIVYFFIHEMATSDYMQQRLESTMEGNSSGRDDLYSFFWHYFTDEADVLHYLIGRGANGTLEIYSSYAHNDWLEIAVNQGILGLVVYVFYFLGFYKTWKCATNTDAKTILALMLFIFFAQTLFSMSYGDMTFVATAPLGYALATVNKPN